MKLTKFLPILLMGALFSCKPSVEYPYQNTRLDFEERAEDLVSRMTLEEKVSQLTNSAAAIERLGIPEYDWWNECLHGVARAGKATVFPQAIGMAATFDRDLMLRMAEITSTEARAKYNDFISRHERGRYKGLTFWSPNINIFRDPRWGRGHETYGEDPYLTGELGVQFIRGLQGDHDRYFKVVATSKHYAVHSGPEPLRHEFDAVTSERDFRDTYLPAFRKTVEEGKVYSVMCAYNRYMGEPCCGSTWLQEELLRGELGFDGYIVSDCGAIRDFHSGHDVVETREEAAALGVLSGTDLNCGSVYPALVEAVGQGLISEEQIDISVERLMLARMKLGMFDPDEMVPWSDDSYDLVSGPGHRLVALEMARKSLVLLKNESDALPLSKDLRKVAVIGPNADNVTVQYGNYNGFPVNPVSVYAGIKSKLGDQAEVRYALGSPHHQDMPYPVTVPGEVLYTDNELSEQGLRGRYFSNLECEGEPVAERTDALIDFYWFDQEPPVEGLNPDTFCVEWTGTLVPEKSGVHSISAAGRSSLLIFDGDTIRNRWGMGRMEKELKAGQPYPIKLILHHRGGDASCNLTWLEPDRNLTGEALQLAGWADHVILVMGLNARLEGEEMRGFELEGFKGGDRTSLDLPDVQQQLIRRMAATGKPVTLVLMSGSTLSINWENEHLDGIIQAWYPGEAGGTAVADVLFGDYNPAGRLPVTFYQSVDDLPGFEDYNMEGKTYRYFGDEVLYPFGYGLSYTDFLYENLILDDDEIPRNGEVTVSVDVTNTGETGGEEVVQLYIRDVESEVKRPLKDLRGFERVWIEAGGTVTVTMTLGPDELAYYDVEQGDYIVEPGWFDILVGPSSSEAALLSTSLRVR
ncbi:MAG: glycoside hydrolase family 3 C-terminal domain-containing protein [Bacteroidales bacterium]